MTPSAGSLIAFVAASAVLIAIPGPNVVYIVTRGIAQGRRAAVASAIGVELGMLVHIAAAATGLSALVTRTALTFATVKIAGAAYLLYLAVRALRGSREASQHEPGTRPRHPADARRLVASGFWVSVLNPKVAVFFLAFLPQFVRPAAGTVLGQTLVLGGVFLLIATVSDLAYAVVAGSAAPRVRAASSRWRSRRRVLEAAVYAGLGATVAVTGSTER